MFRYQNGCGFVARIRYWCYEYCVTAILLVLGQSIGVLYVLEPLTFSTMDIDPSYVAALI